MNYIICVAHRASTGCTRGRRRWRGAGTCCRSTSRTAPPYTGDYYYYYIINININININIIIIIIIIIIITIIIIIIIIIHITNIIIRSTSRTAPPYTAESGPPLSL